MKKRFLLAWIPVLFLIAGCAADAPSSEKEQEYKIGILLSDAGLGDESFNDAAFKGLERARDELSIFFDYREAPDGNFDQALEELVQQENDLVIGLGFTAQEPLEAAAAKHPDQQFLLIDAVSGMKNVTSITFKEHEGSFLVGMIAAMASKSGKLGMIGGEDAPVVRRFEQGFQQGAAYVNKDIEVVSEYANSFGDAELGREMALKQIASGVDFIYPAAGFTGVGAIQAAQDKKVFTAGVDSDQYFVAEKAVVTSMVKNIDVAIYDVVEALVQNGEISKKDYELGLAEKGVGLAPVRNFQLSEQQKKEVESAKAKIIAGDIAISIN